MRSRQVTLAAALLLAALGCATAARVSGWDNPLATSDDGLNILKSKIKSLTRRVSGDENRREEEDYTQRMAFVAIKYRVPPSLHDEFIDAWRDLEAEVDKKEKDNIMYQLAKTAEDNVVFATYGEWETFDDYIEHFHSKHTQEFLDFLEDNDITWELYPLKNVTKVQNERRSTRKLDAESDEDNRRKRERATHVLFHYHAEPSLVRDFIEAWEETAKDVWREQGNMVFSLRKVSTNNHHFIGYGSWESFEDFMDHIKSKHVERLHNFARKNDVLWFFEPVYQLARADRE